MVLQSVCTLQVIWVEGIKQPFMIQKSDGGFGYDTTDMAALRQRVQDERGDWLIYVVDSGQAQHFELVFGASRKAGILPKDPAQPPRAEFVGFGLVLGADGKRIKTRSGKVRGACCCDKTELPGR